MTEPIKITRAEAETQARHKIMKSFPIKNWHDTELEDFIAGAYVNYKIIHD